jgi:hypothetical protein
MDLRYAEKAVGSNRNLEVLGGFCVPKTKIELNGINAKIGRQKRARFRDSTAHSESRLNSATLVICLLKVGV